MVLPYLAVAAVATTATAITTNRIYQTGHPLTTRTDNLVNELKHMAIRAQPWLMAAAVFLTLLPFLVVTWGIVLHPHLQEKLSSTHMIHLFFLTLLAYHAFFSTSKQPDTKSFHQAEKEGG